MKNRVLIGVLLFLGAIGLFALRIFVSPYFLDGFVLLISFMGCLEICNMYKKSNKNVGTIFSLFFCVLAFATVLISIIYNESIYKSLLMVLVTFVSVALLGFILEAFNLGNEKYKKFGLNTLFSMVYPALLYLPMYYINHLTQFSSKLNGADLVPVFLMMLIFFISIFTDTFAFFVGRKLKGPKLAPKISPNKTISGAVGGLLGGIVAGILLFVIFNYALSLVAIFKANYITFITVPILSLLLSAFSQAGDLFASFLKRKNAIKDYSNIFGEQGGIMDRFDGETFVSPIVLIFVLIFII